MNGHFKKPLKVTGIAFVVGILLVIGGGTWVFNMDISDRKKEGRASLMGAGIGGAICLVLAPVWLIAASKVGRERRAAREAKRAAGGE